MNNDYNNDKINLTEELINIFEKIKMDSRYSSKELLSSYLESSEYSELFSEIKANTKMLLDYIKELRIANHLISDENFFYDIIFQKSVEIIGHMKMYYGDLLTPEMIHRLSSFNLSVINDSCIRGDLTAYPEEGIIEINIANFATELDSIENKVVRALGTIPHELFHFLFRILKEEDKCDEIMFWELTNNRKASCLGMAGSIINEGVVEKFSVDFCKEKNIYYTISTSYIQFVNLVNYIMNNCNSADIQFFLNSNYEDVLELFSSETKIAYNEAERFQYINKFKVRLESGELIKVSEDEIVNSYNEKIIRENSCRR